MNPCYSSPCGANAICRVQNNYAICECIPEYHGNPYDRCRPECISNSECTKDKACINYKCIDPCPGTCGLNAECTVTNYVPSCTCPYGMTGDAFRQCQYIPIMSKDHRQHEIFRQHTNFINILNYFSENDPCHPSPCGLNARCTHSAGNVNCECLPGYFGNSYGAGCRPECTINSECNSNNICSNQKCIDPCPSVCGYNAICQTINHSPICTCPEKMNGDPFIECKQRDIKINDPCSPSPCSQNGICKNHNGNAVCIYPECIINSDCSRDRTCINQKCMDPCDNACGVNALCSAINHRAECVCPPEYVGSPLVQCMLQPREPRPECESDYECSNDKSCMNNKCINPCDEIPGICGQNSECHVQIHRAVCSCKSGFTGNAQFICYESKFYFIKFSVCLQLVPLTNSIFSWMPLRFRMSYNRILYKQRMCRSMSLYTMWYQCNL